MTLSIYPFCSIAAILSFIEQHYPENITLSNIAEIVNISERETLDTEDIPAILTSLDKGTQPFVVCDG